MEMLEVKEKVKDGYLLDLIELWNEYYANQNKSSKIIRPTYKLFDYLNYFSGTAIELIVKNTVKNKLWVPSAKWFSSNGYQVVSYTDNQLRDYFEVYCNLLVFKEMFEKQEENEDGQDCGDNA